MRIAAIFTFLGVVLAVSTGCGSAVAGHVNNAADANRVPEDLVVTYDDHHPRWGGERITLAADGTLTIARFRPGEGGGVPQELSGTVPAQAVQQTIDLLASIEAWDQRVENERSRLDDAKARLVIEVGGARSSIWEWANDLQSNGRIVRVKQQLEALAFELREPNLDEAGEPPRDVEAEP